MLSNDSEEECKIDLLFQKVQEKIIETLLYSKESGESTEHDFQSFLDMFYEIKIQPFQYRLGFIGPRGVGKSTLINHILGENLLPTDPLGTATASIIEISHLAGENFSAVITFVNETDWIAELKNFQEQFQLDRDIISEDSDLKETYEKLRALWKTDELQDSQMGNCPEETWNLLRQRFVTMSASNVQKLSTNLIPYAHFMEGNLWPIVEKIHIRGPFRRLSNGITIVDIPGIQDGSLAMTKRAVSVESCDMIWFLTNPQSFLTKAIIKSLEEVILSPKLTIVLTRFASERENILRKYPEWRELDLQAFGRKLLELLLGNCSTSYKDRFRTIDIFCLDLIDAGYRADLDRFISQSIIDPIKKEHAERQKSIENRINSWLNLLHESFRQKNSLTELENLKNRIPSFDNIVSHSMVYIDKCLQDRSGKNPEKLDFANIKYQTIRSACRSPIHPFNVISLEILEKSLSQFDIIITSHMIEERMRSILQNLLDESCQIRFCDGQLDISIKEFISKRILEQNDLIKREINELRVEIRNRLLREINYIFLECFKHISEHIGRGCRNKMIRDAQESYEKFTANGCLQRALRAVAEESLKKFIKMKESSTIEMISSVIDSQKEAIHYYLPLHLLPKNVQELLRNEPSPPLFPLAIAGRLNEIHQIDPVILRPLTISLRLNSIPKREGNLYIFSNESFRKDVYKIGYTTLEPEDRAKQLSRTSVPHPFQVEKWWSCVYAPLAERIMHDLFFRVRIYHSREFFEAPLNLLCKVAEIVVDVLNNA